MNYRIMLMFLRLARLFVADFHAFVLSRIYGSIGGAYREHFEESWNDTEQYWNELNEEDFEE